MSITSPQEVLAILEDGDPTRQEGVGKA